MPRILWSIRHFEFTIEDHYYFSQLKDILTAFADVEESEEPFDLDWLRSFDVVVLNYPERQFSRKEIRKLKRYVRGGGTLIVSAYYQNEDRVAEVASRVTEEFGIRFNLDSVTTPQDGLLVWARSVDDEGVFVPPGLRVFFPCTSSLALTGDASPMLVVDDGAPRVVAADAVWGDGRVICLGTSVFWDNFSLPHGDNERFTREIFRL